MFQVKHSGNSKRGINNTDIIKYILIKARIILMISIEYNLIEDYYIGLIMLPK